LAVNKWKGIPELPKPGKGLKEKEKTVVMLMYIGQVQEEVYIRRASFA
jgi:hypothetical protein